MTTLGWTWAFAVLAAVVGAPAATLAQARPLSDTEKKLAQQLEDASVQQLRTNPSGPIQNKGLSQLAGTSAGRVGRSVITEVTLLGSPGTSAPTDRQARVTRYEYASGVTITTVVDLPTSRVLTTRVELNRPTPLAAEETQRAIVLATRAVPDLANTPRPGLQTIAVVDSRTASRRYGHRLVAVWRDRPASPRVLVDLSTEQVVDANY
jgi:hypothetical protein